VSADDALTQTVDNYFGNNVYSFHLHDGQPGSWSTQEVDRHLEQLSQCGGLFDGYHYIYTLWRSILNRWFACTDGGSLYIASPLLDEDRLGVSILFQCVLVVYSQCKHF